MDDAQPGDDRPSPGHDDLRRADGTRVGRDRLEQLVAEARAEAWDLMHLEATDPVPPS